MPEEGRRTLLLDENQPSMPVTGLGTLGGLKARQIAQRNNIPRWPTRYLCHSEVARCHPPHKDPGRRLSTAPFLV